MPICPGWAARCRWEGVRRGFRICETCVGAGGEAGAVGSCERGRGNGEDRLGRGVLGLGVG